MQTGNPDRCPYRQPTAAKIWRLVSSIVPSRRPSLASGGGVCVLRATREAIQSAERADSGQSRGQSSPLTHASTDDVGFITVQSPPGIRSIRLPTSPRGIWVLCFHASANQRCVADEEAAGLGDRQTAREAEPQGVGLQHRGFTRRAPESWSRLQRAWPRSTSPTTGLPMRRPPPACSNPWREQIRSTGAR